MSEQPKHNQDSPPEPPRRTLIGTVRESLFEKYPEAKPWREYLGEKFRGWRLKRWVMLLLVALLVVGLSVCVTHRIDNSKSDSKARALRLSFSNSNSFLLGKTAQQDEEIRRLQKAFDDMKIDRNEAKREKDVLAQRVSFLESLPDSAANMYSNVLAITNALSALRLGTPQFELFINGSKVGDGAAIALQDSRDVQIAVLNVGDMVAEDLTVDFLIPLAKTNLIVDAHWAIKDVFVRSGDGFKPISVVTGGKVIAQQMVNVGNRFDATTFSISTNVPTCYLPFWVDLYSRGSKDQRFTFILELK